MKKFAEILLIIFLLPIALPIALIFGLYVCIPILLKIQESTYWLSWKDIKRVTGRSTFQVVNTILFCVDSEKTDGILECRFRDEKELNQLRRLYDGANVPERLYPIENEEVVFYEYKFKWTSGSRKKRRVTSILTKIGGLKPVPIRV